MLLALGLADLDVKFDCFSRPLLSSTKNFRTFFFPFFHKVCARLVIAKHFLKSNCSIASPPHLFQDSYYFPDLFRHYAVWVILQVSETHNSHFLGSIPEVCISWIRMNFKHLLVVLNQPQWVTVWPSYRITIFFLFPNAVHTDWFS